jgi:L-threonylcarbamoyladenylate synthase
MTLILPRTDLAKDFITGGQNNVGIRVPAHTVALALLKEFEAQGGLGIAAPSANKFGKVSPTTSTAVELELGPQLSNTDKILNGGLSNIGVESTIIDCTNLQPLILRPGSVSTEMIERVLGVKLNLDLVATKVTKAPGLLANHYAPNAKVFLTGTPSPGDGYIALSDLPTPVGAIRLASPRDNIEYAQILYESLRFGDIKCLKRIFVVPPNNQGVGLAINDRLIKAASHSILI